MIHSAHPWSRRVYAPLKYCSITLRLIGFCTGSGTSQHGIVLVFFIIFAVFVFLYIGFTNVVVSIAIVDIIVADPFGVSGLIS